jgi:tetratricopeptide (TPR) repeat protein
MLGDTDRALEAIESISEEAFLPDVYNFRGTIYEARGDWALAVESFQLGLDTATRTEMQLRAITGLAYSQRKSGDYVGAAKSYQMLVTRAPTADSHFLLAQFYEDAQDAGKSRHHARQAMTLNPGRYQAEGEKLIRKLTVYQFGCLRAFGG